uniref:CUB_2 domain-containing protein n=2 Tax=Caenorhabditis tropicalis TaxID=1561998 RepID=A0A1I7UE03_9PELO
MRIIDPPPTLINVYPADKVPKVYQRNGEGSATILSSTRVDATIIPPPEDDYQGNYCRGILFYDGPDSTFPFIGNGWDLMVSRQKICSGGSFLTISFIGNYSGYDQIPILVQATNDNILLYQGSQEGVTYLDASNGSVALQTMADVVTKVRGTGCLEVYNGRVTEEKTNLVVVYDVAVSHLYFPQQFPGRIKTYLLSNGTASITISQNPRDFKTSKNLTRHGFISSNDYGLAGSSQDSNSTVSSLEAERIRFNVTNLDHGELLVTGYLEKEVVFERKYISSYVPSINPMEFYGDTLVTQFKTNGSLINDFFLTFEITNSSSKYQFIFIFLLILTIYD